VKSARDPDDATDVQPARREEASVLLWGLGTGRRTRALLREGASVEVLALDVDPRRPEDAERIVASCELLTAARTDGRLRLVVGAAADLATRLATRDVPTRMEVDLAALASVPAPARSLARMVERIHLEQADARRHGPQLRANSIANLDAIVDAPSLHTIAGASAGRPAFVLAAGPSAASAMDWLGEARRHGPLVAVDTALPLCRRAGVPVDCLVSVDPHPTSAVHLSEGSADVGLLAFQPYCAPAIVEAFPRRVLALPRGDRLCDRAARLLDLPSLPIANTVLLFALQVAATLGCGPIVLIGADFAHVGGRSHAVGTATSRALGPSGLVVENGSGEAVPTSSALLRFLADVERHIAESGVPHVAVDGGGAAIAGARRVSASACARWLRRRPTIPAAMLGAPAAVTPAVAARRRTVWTTLAREMG
jgi:hypothetical protein